LPRFLEALQGKVVVGEIAVPIDTIRRKAQTLLRDLRGFFILPRFGIHEAQIDVRWHLSWVALNLLLISLGRFLQLASYKLVVGGGDRQLFPLAGMFSQLKCLRVILA